MKTLKEVFFLVGFLLGFALNGCSSGGGVSSTSISVDNTDLNVTMISPLPDATGVSTSVNIQFMFSDIIISGIDSENVTLHEGRVNGQSITLGTFIEGSSNTYIVSPVSPLKKSTSYYFVLDTGIMSKTGHLNKTIFNFTTGNSSPPTVLLITPSNGQMNVSQSLSLQIVFSEAVLGVDSNNITLHQGSISGPTVALGSFIAGSDNTYTFSPASALSGNTTYYLVLGAGISSSSGNLNATSYSFTTGDFIAPTVNIVSPSNNATNVLRNTSIVLQFSEAVNNVNATSITLHNGSPTGPILPLSLVANDLINNTATFSLNGILDGQGTYYLEFTGITDLFANPLATSSISFTAVSTGAACWGTNAQGQLNIPTLLNPTSISAGGHHTCAIDDTGLHCWGLNASGQTSVPLLVNPTSVSAGGHHTCVIDTWTDGTNHVVCWGRNTFGQATVPTLVNPTSISAGGENNTCAIDDTGLHCWGDNGSNQITNMPTLINPILVSVGDLQICALDIVGVYCWGNNGVVPSLTNPVIVSTKYTNRCALDRTGIICWNGLASPTGLVSPTSVSVGYLHACAIDETGVHCWGANNFGQLNVPVLLNPTNLSVGRYHACVIQDI